MQVARELEGVLSNARATRFGDLRAPLHFLVARPVRSVAMVRKSLWRGFTPNLRR